MLAQSVWNCYIARLLRWLVIVLHEQILIFCVINNVKFIFDRSLGLLLQIARFCGFCWFSSQSYRLWQMHAQHLSLFVAQIPCKCLILKLLDQKFVTFLFLKRKLLIDNLSCPKFILCHFLGHLKVALDLNRLCELNLTEIVYLRLLKVCLLWLFTLLFFFTFLQ